MLSEMNTISKLMCVNYCDCAEYCARLLIMCVKVDIAKHSNQGCLLLNPLYFLLDGNKAGIWCGTEKTGPGKPESGGTRRRHQKLYFLRDLQESLP